jgi:hypothetical protein
MLEFVALLAATTPSVDAQSAMLTAFKGACMKQQTYAELTEAVTKQGWKLYQNSSDSPMAHEFELVAPMLEQQGLASDVSFFSYNGDVHFELAVTLTRKPISGEKKLVGCSMYNFDAVAPIENPALETVAGSNSGVRTTAGDVQVEKWDGFLGPNSGMRAVFVPKNSPYGAQLGFTGMMLGTHFLEGSE